MQEYLDAAKRGTPEFYKRNLPIPFVFEKRGIQTIQKDGKLAVVCPMHDDSDPSLDIFMDDSGWRWGCYPCGKGGDVLDLLGNLEGVAGFADRMSLASDEFDEMPEGWEPPLIESRKSLWNVERELTFVQQANLDSSAVFRFGLDDSVRDAFRLGSSGEDIIIPYYNRAGTLVAWKHRAPAGKAVSSPGSTLRGVLYGEWRDTDPSVPVLLCEGESDCWAAWSELGTQYSVLAVPGAGMNPSAEGLDGRRVLLAFDGDRAGRTATKKWAAYLLGLGCVVEFLPVPDGKDLRSLPSIEDLISARRSMKPAPDQFKEHGDIYVRPGKETNTMLTNWRLEPERELTTAEGGTAYEGVLLPAGKRVTLSSHDLSSKARIVSWCSRYGVSWMGADRDAQALLAFLQSRGPFLSPGFLVTEAGLHGTAFVWPGGKAGDSSLVYAPPQADVHLEQRLRLPKDDWTPIQVQALRKLHRQDVMDPILGWLAAAPIRSLLGSFPTLAVTGSSGSGKTTLMQTVLAAFSGADISTNLTSTTKHALASFMASTNAFPVWFDEYRPGARKDTQLALEQLLRDAYTGQISAKGGLGEHWSEISAMHTNAPIVVSGEDTFTETSHTERMVNLPLPSAGKNPEILTDVRGWGPTGLPRAYLEWISKRLTLDDVDLVVRPYAVNGIPGRQADNLGVVMLGWRLLDRFCQENGLESLGEPDLSLVIDAGVEAASHNPIKDALLWALDEVDTSGFIQRHGDTVYLRVDSFVHHIEKLGIFTLPGRSAAVKRYIKDHYKAQDATLKFYSQSPVTCLSFDVGLLDV